jgi:hypothetical protein
MQILAFPPRRDLEFWNGIIRVNSVLDRSGLFLCFVYVVRFVQKLTFSHPTRHVRFGSLAGIGTASFKVRITPESGNLARARTHKTSSQMIVACLRRPG